MSNYVEKTEGWEITTGAGGSTGTRVFGEDDSGTVTELPAIGDPFDADDYPKVKAISCRKVKWGNHPGKHLYTYSYSDAPGATEGTGGTSTVTDPDFLPISGSLGTEVVNVDATKTSLAGKYAWDDETGGSVNQSFFKTYTTGTFKITRRVSILRLELYAELGGCVNDAIFEVLKNKFPIGAVIFNGAEYEEYINDFGFKRYKVGLSFSVKMIVSSGIYYGAWNYLFDEVNGYWRKVKNVASGQPLYVAADLTSLLSESKHILIGDPT